MGAKRFGLSWNRHHDMYEIYFLNSIKEQTLIYWTSGNVRQWSLSDGKQMTDGKQNDCKGLLPGKKFPGFSTRRENTNRVQWSPQFRKHNWELGNPRWLEFTRLRTNTNLNPLLWHIRFCIIWSNHLPPVLYLWESSPLNIIFPASQTTCSSLSVFLSLLSTLDMMMFPCWILTQWLNLNSSTSTSVKSFLIFYF